MLAHAARGTFQWLGVHQHVGELRGRWRDDFNQWLGLTIGNQWWQPMMGLIGAGLLWYRWRNLLQRTWRFLDDAISLPVSILWVGSLARSSSRSFVHALTWGINLAIMTNVRAMSTIQQTWGMFEATWDETMCKMMAISSWKSCFKTEPTSDTFFFPNVLCGRSCNLSSTRQDSLERITGSSLRFQQWEATGNRAARPVTFPRLLHKLLGVNTDTHNSCHLPMLMSSVTRTALGFQVYAEMGWWSQWRQQQFWGPDVAPDAWRQTNWRQPVMRDRGINNSGNSMLNLVLSQQLLRTGKPWVLDITWSNNGWIWVNK